MTILNDVIARGNKPSVQFSSARSNPRALLFNSRKDVTTFGKYLRQEEAYRAILAAGGRFDGKQIVCAPGIKTVGAIDFLTKRLGYTRQRAAHRLTRKPCGQHRDRKIRLRATSLCSPAQIVGFE